MRTTINLDEHLLREAKALAAATGKSLTSVVEDALRENLARRQAKPKRRIVLPTDKGGTLLPGVDLDDSAALLELMERSHASS